MKNIHLKITAKEYFDFIPKNELIKSNYDIYLDVTDFEIRDYGVFPPTTDVDRRKVKYMLQIPVGVFEVVSENPDLYVDKYTLGKYFTYRVIKTENPNCWTNKRAGDDGIRIIANIKNLLEYYAIKVDK